jgi:hypothetical protein
MVSKNKFWKTLEMTAGLCFVISVTGLIRPDSGKDDNRDEEFL